MLRGTTWEDEVWPPCERMVAQCRQDIAMVAAFGVDPASHGDTPSVKCKCGVHAQQTSRVVAQFGAGGLGSRLRGYARIWGRVSLWGRIVECENGWRAQYGYPYELFIADQTWSEGERRSLAAQVRNRYAVDCYAR